MTPSPLKLRFTRSFSLIKQHLKVPPPSLPTIYHTMLVSIELKISLSLIVSHIYQLCPQEHILCVSSCTLTSNDEERVVYVVGTALVKPEEKESSTGRILVFSVNAGWRVLFLVFYF